MVLFSEEQKLELIMNYTESINQIKMRDECWKSITNNPECPWDSVPDDEKFMITKHHAREILYYETQRDMYKAIVQGKTKNMKKRRTALLGYARGVMDDMIEADVYEESLYIDVCDAFKDKINVMDTWINAGK